MTNKKIVNKVVSGAITLGGAVLGEAVAGPIGGIAGATVSAALQWGASEIATRLLSKSEKRKLETVLDYAKKEIEKKINAGKSLRKDGFFHSSVDERSSAEELLEGVLISAQRENEERKLPYLGKMYANLCFQEAISREVANSLLKLANELTYRDFVILKCVAICQNNSHIHKKTAYSEIKGLENVSIATDTYALYQRGILHTKSTSVLLSAGGIDPSDLTVNGVGAFLYQLLELETMPFDDLFNKTFTFFSNTIIE